MFNSSKLLFLFLLFYTFDALGQPYQVTVRAQTPRVWGVQTTLRGTPTRFGGIPSTNFTIPPNAPIFRAPVGTVFTPTINTRNGDRMPSIGRPDYTVDPVPHVEPIRTVLPQTKQEQLEILINITRDKGPQLDNPGIQYQPRPQTYTNVRPHYFPSRTRIGILPDRNLTLDEIAIASGHAIETRENVPRYPSLGINVTPEAAETYIKLGIQPPRMMGAAPAVPQISVDFSTALRYGSCPGGCNPRALAVGSAAYKSPRGVIYEASRAVCLSCKTTYEADRGSDGHRRDSIITGSGQRKRERLNVVEKPIVNFRNQATMEAAGSAAYKNAAENMINRLQPGNNQRN